MTTPAMSWRDNIRPLVLDFIDANSDAPKRAKPKVVSVNKKSTAAS